MCSFYQLKVIILELRISEDLCLLIPFNEKVSKNTYNFFKGIFLHFPKRCEVNEFFIEGNPLLRFNVQGWGLSKPWGVKALTIIDYWFILYRL